MPSLFDHPLFFFPAVVVFLLLAAWIGAWARSRREAVIAEFHSATLSTLQGAVFGLLGLLLGFTFSMAVSRYDLRKSLELEEANAIGTTWLRTAILEPQQRVAAQAILRAYVPVRLQFLTVGNDAGAVAGSLARAGELQGQLWAIAADEAQRHRDPASALFASSVNDTIDVTEKRTTALENRIPAAAWCMLLFMAVASSVLVGLGVQARSWLLLLVLPLVVGAALTLILDLDSPRTGFVRVQQHSMERVAAQVAGPTP